MRATGVSIATLTLLYLAVPPATRAVDQPVATTGQATIRTAHDGEWMPLPDVFPPGAQFKVINGDPGRGPTDFYMRFPAGYVMPWHFHTAVEKVLMDKGMLQFEVRGGQKASVGEGGYVDLPSRVPHRATCTGGSDCLIYLTSNAPFDIYLVNDAWNVTKSWSAAGATPTSTSYRK